MTETRHSFFFFTKVHFFLSATLPHDPIKLYQDKCHQWIHFLPYLISLLLWLLGQFCFALKHHVKVLWNTSSTSPQPWQPKPLHNIDKHPLGAKWPRWTTAGLLNMIFTCHLVLWAPGDHEKPLHNSVRSLKKPMWMRCWLHLRTPLMDLGEDWLSLKRSINKPLKKIAKQFKHRNWLRLSGRSQNICLNINLSCFQ